MNSLAIHRSTSNMCSECRHATDSASTSAVSDPLPCHSRTVSTAAPEEATGSNSCPNRATWRTAINDTTNSIRPASTPWRFIISAILIVTQLSIVIPTASAKRVSVDWTLESNLFNKGNGIKTKYVRMNDILNIRCAPVISLKIYMVPKESALFCRAPAAKDQDPSGRRLRQTIGTCAPNSSSPTVKVRSTALANSPVFQPRQHYFLITTSTGTSEGIENEEGGLCQSHGMRLRLVVVDETDPLPGDELTNFDEIFPNLRMPVNNPNSHGEPGQISGEERGYDMTLNRRKMTAPSLRQVPPPDYGGDSAAWQRRQLGSGGESRTSMPSAETVHSSRGFPAMLEVEENGRKKTITVYNSRQLHEEIEYAKERNNRIQRVREIPDYASVRQLPEYTMTGHGKISALPISTNRPLGNSRTRDVDGADTGVWLRSAALGSHRRNAASQSQPPADVDDSIEPSIVRSPAYSSSLKAADAAEHDSSNMPISNADARRPIPFTYVVGYTSSDSGYGDTDDMILDEPASSAPVTRCLSTWLLYTVCILLAANMMPIVLGS